MAANFTDATATAPAKPNPMQDRAFRARLTRCHQAHVRDWPIRAKVWVWWGLSQFNGWKRATVVGHTRSRVRCLLKDELKYVGRDRELAPWTTCVAPSKLQPRKRDDAPPPRSRGNISCLALSRAGR